jgi:hypothetical protein
MRSCLARHVRCAALCGREHRSWTCALAAPAAGVVGAGRRRLLGRALAAGAVGGAGAMCKCVCTFHLRGGPAAVAACWGSALAECVVWVGNETVGWGHLSRGQAASARLLAIAAAATVAYVMGCCLCRGLSLRWRAHGGFELMAHACTLPGGGLHSSCRPAFWHAQGCDVVQCSLRSV